MSSNFVFKKLQPIEWMLFALIVLAPLYYHYNLGGTGFRLPSNITVWAAGSVIIFYSLYRLASGPRIILPQYSLLLLSFPLLAIYGAMMSGIIVPEQWFFRLLYVIGGTVFLFSLFQYKLTPSRIDRVLLFIVIAAFCNASVGLAQVVLVNDFPRWLPYNKSAMPTGIIQQINNQGSFQVTGLLISFWLLTRPMLNKKVSFTLVFILIYIAISTFIISYSGSRVAVLGFMLATPLLLLGRRRQIYRHKIRWLIVLLLISCSVITASKFEHERGLSAVAEKTAAMNSGFSGSARLGIYSIAYEVIKESPWLGHGIGSFVREWQLAKPAFYHSHPDAVLPGSRVSHPHNEIIFWLVEGGLVVTFGLFCVFLAIVLALLKLPSSRRYAYAALILPLTLHTQVELPFYISSILWFVYLVLLFVIFKPLTREHQLSLSAAAQLTVKTVSIITALATATFLVHSMLASLEFKSYIQQKNKLETFEIAIDNPYFRGLVMDRMMSRLLYQSIKTGQDKTVSDIASWMDAQLKNNPHFMYYRSLSRAYHYLGDEAKMCSYASKGHSIYPDNVTLKSIAKSCNK